MPNNSEDTPIKGVLIFYGKMTQAAATNKAPEIPDYELIAKIGQGGSARIYKAKQKSLSRFVAIKVLSHELSRDPDIVRRFDRESITIARLSHPNIVHIIDRGKVDDQYYFVMEFVDGMSLKDMIASDRFNLRQKLEVVIMVLKGLDYAHKNGVIHRDIKPANILIDKSGNAQIADFGIAQILNMSDNDHTRSDIIMGTLAYMSPEQRISSTNVSLATDIFSIGVILYEILVGKRPQGKFPMPSEANPELPVEFDDIIKTCLAMEPENRYQSAVELKDAILDIIAGRPVQEVAPRSSITGVESFIGKCQFLDTIKETKYSTTMLVENRETRELFVIKKNDRSCDGLKEARILSKLKHENIINIFGAGGDQRRLVVVMEYAQGGSLADRMIRPYELRRAIKIIRNIANGLFFAHQNGIVHGNLRPSNILFSKDEVLKLTDFGLPPHYNLMEKNWYAPPEKRVSKQADLYALGVVFHKLLYGKTPTYGRNTHLILGSTDEPMPEIMRQILRKLLAFKIANRYQDFGEFFEDWTLLERTYSKELESAKDEEKDVTSIFFRPSFQLGLAAAVVVIIVLLLLFRDLF